MKFNDFFETLLKGHLNSIKDALEQRRKADNNKETKAFEERLRQVVIEEKKLQRLKDAFEKQRMKELDRIAYKEAYNGFIQTDPSYSYRGRRQTGLELLGTIAIASLIIVSILIYIF